MKRIEVIITFDVGPMVASLRRMGAALAAIAEPARKMRESIVRRTAIERYDIPESDIRRVDGSTVVLWNRRRIAIDVTRRRT